MATTTIDIDTDIADRLRARAADARMSLDEYLAAIAEAEGLVPVSAEFRALAQSLIGRYRPLFDRLAE